MEQTIVGIDVGTTKICTLIGQLDDQEDETLRIVGVGVVPARGMHKGVVVDISEATEAIGESIQRAERSGYSISEAYVAVGGAHISSQNSRGVAAIGRGDRPVDRDDIDRALEAARAIPVPHNRTIIHTVPREYFIDEQDGIKNPLGFMGFRLEVEAHLVTGSLSATQNLIQCVEKNGVDVLDLVVQPLASAEAVLGPDEKDVGVALVDMGGGTIDVAIYLEGSVWETLVVPLGGNHISSDIALGLRTPIPVAEELKVRYAHALPGAVDEAEIIEYRTFGADAVSTVPRRRLCEIVSARTSEMFDLIFGELRRSGFESLLAAGVVLTGGTASLRGLHHIALSKLGLPIRVGAPGGLQGFTEAITSPAYATGVGLLHWGRRQQQEQRSIGRTLGSVSHGTWYRRAVGWMRNNVFLPGS